MNNEFSYFFHGTTVNDSKLIDEIFNNGLLNYRGTSMLSTLWPVKIGEGELAKKAKEYCGTKGNAVFVIKIPKYYLTPKVVDGQIKQIPLPIWKKVDINGEHGDIYQLTPELIYGVYLDDPDSFRFNNNYSPVHNPDGLHYSNEQIDYLLDHDALYMYNLAINRNDKTYNELKTIDQIENNWENATKQYSEHFGVKEVKSTNYK